MMEVSPTTLTLSNGRHVDLLNPQVDDVCFPVICEHLAKANRYCGATPGAAFSVAQHSVLCAQAALLATGDRQLAAYLLCHDMHEAFFGDDTTPKKRALAAIIGSFGVLASHISDTFNLLTFRMDAVIHAAAGLAWPPPLQTQLAIKHWDRVLLATEWRDLMMCAPPFKLEAPIPDVIVPHEHWRSAAREMLRLCIDLLPSMPPIGGEA